MQCDPSFPQTPPQVRQVVADIAEVLGDRQPLIADGIHAGRRSGTVPEPEHLRKADVLPECGIGEVRDEHAVVGCSPQGDRFGTPLPSARSDLWWPNTYRGNRAFPMFGAGCLVVGDLGRRDQQSGDRVDKGGLPEPMSPVTRPFAPSSSRLHTRSWKVPQLVDPRRQPETDGLGIVKVQFEGVGHDASWRRRQDTRTAVHRNPPATERRRMPDDAADLVGVGLIAQRPAKPSSTILRRSDSTSSVSRAC